MQPTRGLPNGLNLLVEQAQEKGLLTCELSAQDITSELLLIAMPSNYVVMDSEEMSYVDGGFYISNSLIKSMVITSCLNPVGATLVGLGIYKLVSYIALSGAKLGAKIGGIVGGVVGSCIGGLSGAAICGSAAWTVARALIEKKGIGVDFAYTSFGMPYCIDINIR